MYNRYIPQSDGSYRRSRVPDPASPPPKKQPEHTPVCQESCPSEQAPAMPQRVASCPRSSRRPQRPASPPQSTSIGKFLKNLLPKDFDTGDLVVVLLLLLMSADCQDEQNTSLLTLVLYLFL